MIEKAKVEDITKLLEIYDQAKIFMRETGNLHQWNSTYPDYEVLLNDINNHQLYKVVDNNKICGVFAFILGEDPTYNKINGKWLNSSTYGTIHRIASIGNKVFEECINYCTTCINHLRIDTHEDNKVMQYLILKYNFKYCGIIYLENGDPRLAYELIKGDIHE